MDCTSHENQGKLQAVYGDVTLGVHGKGFDFLFSYSAGGPVSLVLEGKEWLYRVPRPAFWRAATDNDRENGFSFRSSMWMGADAFVKTETIRITADGKEMKNVTAPGNNRFGGAVSCHEISVEYTYVTSTVPQARVKVEYRVGEGGEIRVKVHYYGAEGLPELPVFGLRFIMPTKAKGYVYEGLSGETYPDRMAGGKWGTYQIEGLPVTPYLTPQDCGVHMGTERLTVVRSFVLANDRRNTGDFALCFAMDENRPFAFSCLPYTPLELESATHQEELPPARRTVVTIMGAVRGVGGIDTWGSDVEEACHISGEKEIEFSFIIRRAGI